MRTPVVLTWLVLGALLFAGCRIGQRRRGTDEVTRLRNAASAAWVSRSAPGGLDLARQASLAVLARRPEDAASLTRLSRIEWIAAHDAPESAVTRFAEGREYAWRCLQTDPSFGAALSADSGRLTRANLESVEGASGVCLGLMATHTIGLMDELGPGSWVELTELKLVSVRLDALAAASGAAAGSVAQAAWVAGRIAGLGPDPDRDAEAKKLDEAWQRAPDVLLYPWSLGEAVPERQHELAAAAAAPREIEDRVFYDRIVAWAAAD